MQNNKIKQKTLVKLFPFINNKNKIDQLQIDYDSLHYISIREVAEAITSILIIHIENIKLDNHDIVITDATAGVGGNTISFSDKFNKVNSIEINKQRFSYLKNNINVYGFQNIELYNDNCLNLLNKIYHDVVFIDPPWGGRKYKYKKKLLLNLSDTPLESICNDLLNENITKYPPKIILLKIPKNYNLRHFYNVVQSNKIYLYNLKKMYIVVIINIKI
jgi:16S rRNA G966 N2-methylase RsmD